MEMLEKNKKILTVIFLISLMILTGCANNQGPKTGETRLITDGAGRQVEIPEDIESIVCWNVNSLRYTTYMQAQDLVIGVEDYEKEQSYQRPYNYLNFDLFKDLPIVGSNGEHYIEEVIAVNPDIIVMSSFDTGDADSIQSTTGIPVVIVPGSDKTMDDNAYETFKIMGELYKKEDRAEELIAYLDEIKEDLETRTGNIADEDKPSVYVGGVSFKGHHGLEGTEAYYGPLDLINAKNLANESDQKGPFNADLEMVLEWNPDVLFIDYNGLPLINEDYEKNKEYYQKLKAIEDDKVYAQISYRHSAVNLDMALINTYYAGSVLYPEEFSDIDPVGKADEIFNKFLGNDFYHVLKENGLEFKQVTIGE